MNMIETNHYQDTQISLIPRQVIPGISTMNVEGTARNLGIVKNFKNHPLLDRLLPNDFSIAWVHLDPQEVLDVHSHNVASMIIAADGHATSQGDTHIAFGEGDIVIIPAWNEHGFTGADSGFWGLSIQFNELAIFETEENPLTTYKNEPKPTKDERQLIVFNRNQTDFSKTLNRYVPGGLSFRWVCAEQNTTIEPPTSGRSRMILVCNTDAPTFTGDTTLHPGTVIIEQSSITINGAAWLLVIEFNGGGK